MHLSLRLCTFWHISFGILVINLIFPRWEMDLVDFYSQGYFGVNFTSVRIFDTIITADVEINLSPHFTKVVHTTHNLSLSRAIAYLSLIWITQLSIGMSSLVVFTVIAALSLSQFLVGHDDIKSPFLVFVLKVSTSFRNTQ